MRPIDADALLAKMICTSRYFSVKFDIEEMPTLSYKDLVPQGEWKVISYNKTDGTVMVECECGAVFKLSMFDYGLSYNFCPHCGTRMVNP